MNKKVALAVAGIGAFVTGAMAFHYFASQPTPTKFAQLYKELDLVGKLNKD
jgi:hypothetical protein